MFSQDEAVDLRDNAIDTLKDLTHLSGLRRLYLGRNILSRAEELSCFRRLEVLDLSDNRLTNLDLTLLKALNTINLAGALSLMYTSLRPERELSTRH